MTSTWTTRTAAEAVTCLLNDEDLDEGVRAVVRMAYDATYREANGLQSADAAAAFRMAAQVATAGRLTTEDLVNAVRYNMGL